jgi:hypothetical protein
VYHNKDGGAQGCGQGRQKDGQRLDPAGGSADDNPVDARLQGLRRPHDASVFWKIRSW